MVVRVLCVAVLLSTGCEPPPEVELGSTEVPEPAVTVVYPPGQNPDGEGPFPVYRDAETGHVDFLVVVDIDNFDLVDPYDEAHAENRDGEGHWHLVAGSDVLPVVGLSFANVHFDAEDVADEQVLTITAQLRENDHSAVLDSNGAEIDATVEVQVHEAG